MEIPGFQAFMLPLLTFAADGREHSVRDAHEEMSRRFELPAEALGQLLPSGRQSVFDNRVGWARTYLRKAGLLATHRRGYYTITQRGRALLAENPPTVNIAVLERFPEFVEFRRRGEGNEPPPSPDRKVNEQTPYEALEYGSQRLRQDLADELLAKVKAAEPQFFERLVVRLLIAMGYGGAGGAARQVVGRPGDEGIDGIIDEDALGLDVLYVQAKRWNGTVGRPEIQRFVGALHGQQASKGVFITTSEFTSEAENYARGVQTRVVLVDGTRLAGLMIDYGIGVSVVSRYEIKRVDSDYFTES